MQTDKGYDAAALYNARLVVVEPRPDGVGGGGTGLPYSPELTPGCICYYLHRDYGTCIFQRYDGGYAVIELGKEYLLPDAPAWNRRLGAHPKGGLFWAPVDTILVPVEG